jgi:hypothetical protein
MYIYDGKVSHMRQWDYNQSINRSFGYKVKEGVMLELIFIYLQYPL